MYFHEPVVRKNAANECRLSWKTSCHTVEYGTIFDGSSTGEYYSEYMNWIVYNPYELTDNSPVHFGL